MDKTAGGTAIAQEFKYHVACFEKTCITSRDGSSVWQEPVYKAQLGCFCQQTQPESTKHGQCGLERLRNIVVKMYDKSSERMVLMMEGWTCFLEAISPTLAAIPACNTVLTTKQNAYGSINTLNQKHKVLQTGDASGKVICGRSIADRELVKDEVWTHM